MKKIKKVITKKRKHSSSAESDDSFDNQPMYKGRR